MEPLTSDRTLTAEELTALNEAGRLQIAEEELTREKLRTMSPAEIVKAQAEGHLKHLGVGS